MTTLEAGNDTGTAWLLCPACGAMIYAARYERTARVCPECDGHGMLTADQRIGQLADPDSAVPIEAPVTVRDPLGFTDSRPYPERMGQARERTGMPDAVRCVRATLGGTPVVLAVMDFRFLGGSLGSAVGAAVTAAADTALATRSPLIIVAASGGARMQEGIVALMQMAKTSVALRRLDDAGILTVSVVTDPTYGGVAASFATSTDIIIAEPGARLGFAGPRVIRQTIGETLPPGFQTAEFLLEHGIVDLIAHRSALRDTLIRLVALTVRPTRTAVPDPDAVLTDPTRLADRDPWERVRAARELGRPTTLEHIAGAFEEFTELHGDRMAADCPAMVAGLARLGGVPVAVVGTQKGHTAAELARRNYGMPSPAGYRKAARVLRLAAKLGLPVIALIDTAGAYPGVAAERQGQAVAIAESLKLLAGLPVPVVSVITGEGGSGGALALALADRVLVCENAVYSVISPEGCAAILWQDPAAAPRAAAALRVDAAALLELGIADAVVPEPAGGADADPLAATELLGRALRLAVHELRAWPVAELHTGRHARFRAFGIAREDLQETR
ncbi:acetyl-CoA carboxylase, carboxyltransferase subunit beta [Nocardia otitidiscaviarum]|uniref:acetyl-CoA carboxylase, carboxyltransferase subunit beta n=1 Tax=Nocardia otitidiscaviarum TaxID=1823 RepID=UPI001893A9AB|nr:acetyl-CoA carboxylase, carboxyltransferase subunit beta [Nocardia otitidiscaviarum]MBF6177411.1 acetyl-CoA carboxylase, carboxyltransferase subunit beta [Nocardia otitidiscaviarum]